MRLEQYVLVAIFFRLLTNLIYINVTVFFQENA